MSRGPVRSVVPKSLRSELDLTQTGQGRSSFERLAPELIPPHVAISTSSSGFKVVPIQDSQMGGLAEAHLERLGNIQEAVAERYIRLANSTAVRSPLSPDALKVFQRTERVLRSLGRLLKPEDVGPIIFPIGLPGVLTTAATGGLALARGAAILTSGPNGPSRPRQNTDVMRVQSGSEARDLRNQGVSDEALATRSSARVWDNNQWKRSRRIYTRLPKTSVPAAARRTTQPPRTQPARAQTLQSGRRDTQPPNIVDAAKAGNHAALLQLRQWAAAKHENAIMALVELTTVNDPIVSETAYDDLTTLTIDENPTATKALSQLAMRGEPQAFKQLRIAVEEGNTTAFNVLIYLLDHGNITTQNLAIRALMELRDADLPPQIMTALNQRLESGDAVIATIRDMTIRTPVQDPQGFADTISIDSSEMTNQPDPIRQFTNYGMEGSLAAVGHLAQAVRLNINGAVGALITLFDQGPEDAKAAARRYLISLSTTRAKEMSQTLSQLAARGNLTALKIISEYAGRGHKLYLKALGQVADYGVSDTRNHALKYITYLIKMGDPTATEIIKGLARGGNNAALKAISDASAGGITAATHILINLARDGSTRAVRATAVKELERPARSGDSPTNKDLAIKGLMDLTKTRIPVVANQALRVLESLPVN